MYYGLPLPILSTILLYSLLHISLGLMALQLSLGPWGSALRSLNPWVRGEGGMEILAGSCSLGSISLSSLFSLSLMLWFGGQWELGY